MIAGHFLDDAWGIVALRADADCAQALRPLTRRRLATAPRVFDTEADLLEFWKTRPDSLRAVCIAGAGVSWATEERLRLAGAIVGRLPFPEAHAHERFARRLVDRERALEALPRKAWVLVGDPDPFTECLDAVFAGPILKRLERHGFEVRLAIGRQADTLAGDPTPGIAVLLAHGMDPPDTGVPAGVPGLVREVLLSASAAGAVIVHLGCNGAGTVARGRFGDVASELGLEVPFTETDTFDAFGAACLGAGASAVVGHVDSTWSTAFDTATPVLDFIDWVASGRGSFGHGLESLATEALRAGTEAHDLLRRQKPLDAGLAWLRHLDLRGFVLLGDPSAYCRWK
jgi:hypothetical protein